MYLENVFAQILNMSLTASIVIVCVLLARLLLKKAPKVFSYALWAVVLFRLLCPVSVSSGLSVLNLVDVPEPERRVDAIEYVPTNIVQAPLETEHVEPDPGREATAPVLSAPEEPAPAPVDWHLIAAWVWAAGVCAMAGYSVISYVNLKRKLREAVPLREGVYLADGIESPFVMGALRPKIYLPSGLGARERGYIILHEKYHVGRLDHWVKILAWWALCLHWFNPLVWAAFQQSGQDMEMSCDEAVLKKLGPQVRSDYAQSLLNLATGRRVFACVPLAFGEGDTGKRVKNVLDWKAAAGWVLVLCPMVCFLVMVATALNPGQSGLFAETPFGHCYRAEEVVLAPEGEAVSLNTRYVMTSDTYFYYQDGGSSVHPGNFIQSELNGGFVLADAELEQQLRRENQSAWRLDGSNWWLLLQEDGGIYLTQGDDTVVKLSRTDLLTLSVNEPGVHAYIEPIWYADGDEGWWHEAISGHNVDGEATIVFHPEMDLETLTVREEYYKRLSDESTEILESTYTLTRDAEGSFFLDVGRRGDAGDDKAIYHVSLESGNYVFQLNFPATPGVTEFGGYPEEETRLVEFSGGGGYIQLELPMDWEYSVTELGEDDFSAGIAFWPRGREEGKIRLEYYPQLFGVCGTGLETQEVTLNNGTVVSMGTYDGRPVWDFLVFPVEAEGDFAAIGEGHESWWPEYGTDAMNILASARMGEYVDMEAEAAFFRDYRLGDLGEGQVLRGEKDYQGVYYPKDNTLRLYEYTAYGTTVEVDNVWTGVVYDDSCISINLLQREGEYVYFGYLRDRHGETSVAEGHFAFLLEDGWVIDMMLTELDGFCFVCDEPLADFQITDEAGQLVLDLEGYLGQGCAVNPAGSE